MQSCTETCTTLGRKPVKTTSNTKCSIPYVHSYHAHTTNLKVPQALPVTHFLIISRWDFPQVQKLWAMREGTLCMQDSHADNVIMDEVIVSKTASNLSFFVFWMICFGLVFPFVPLSMDLAVLWCSYFTMYVLGIRTNSHPRIISYWSTADSGPTISITFAKNVYDCVFYLSWQE